jgi:hypothetical protein
VRTHRSIAHAPAGGTDPVGPSSQTDITIASGRSHPGCLWCRSRSSVKQSASERVTERAVHARGCLRRRAHASAPCARLGHVEAIPGWAESLGLGPSAAGRSFFYFHFMFPFILNSFDSKFCTQLKCKFEFILAMQLVMPSCGEVILIIILFYIRYYFLLSSNPLLIIILFNSYYYCF